LHSGDAILHEFGDVLVTKYLVTDFGGEAISKGYCFAADGDFFLGHSSFCLSSRENRKAHFLFSWNYRPLAAKAELADRRAAFRGLCGNGKFSVAVELCGVFTI
jgi:hypothetical protein